MPELRSSQVMKKPDENVQINEEIQPKEATLCGKCGSEVTEAEKALNCECCSVWWHCSCVDVSDTKYKFLMNNTDLHWFCQLCDLASKKLYVEVVNLKAENALLRQNVCVLESKLDDVMRIVDKDRIDAIIASDRNETYSRKDSLRISGIPHEGNETNQELESKIISIASKAGVKLEREEISIAHRLKKDRKGKLPTIIKFSTRKSKEKLYAAKKNLKGVPEMEDVFISEDLTRLRFRTLLQAKRAENIKSISTKGGKIFVWLIGSDKPITVESPYDLKRLNLEPDWDFLGIQRR